MHDISWDFMMTVKTTIPNAGYSNDRLGIILINFLLEWAGCAKINCYDEKFTPVFLGLTYGEVITETDVVNYIAEIEQEMTGHNGILDVTVHEIMEKLDPKQVRRFFSEFATVKHKKVEEFFPLMAELMTWDMIDNPSELAGRYYVNVLERDLIDITPEMSFYDGCCGSGIGAVTIARGCKSVYLQDINRRCVFYTTIACIFRGIPAHNITVGDSLVNAVQTGMKFDRIVMEPPARFRYPKDYYMHIPDGNVMLPELEEDGTLYLRHALARLNDSGVAAVLVPAGVLYKTSAKVMEARNKIIPYIDAVVYLPGGIGFQGNGISSAIIVLKKNKNDHVIYMLDTSDYTLKEQGNRYFPSDNLDEVTRIFKERNVIDNVSAIVTEQQVIEAECNLTPSKYVKTVVAQVFNPDEMQRDLDRSVELLKELNHIDQQLAELRSVDMR